jgi:tetratricopeptide (TPR) repeat protein
MRTREAAAAEPTAASALPSDAAAAPGIASPTVASTAVAPPVASASTGAASVAAIGQPSARRVSLSAPATPAPATPPASNATSSAGAAPLAAAARIVDPLAEPIRVARAKLDARLYDQGIADLKAALSQHPSSTSAPAAQLLIASVYEKQGQLPDAMAAYVELRSKYTPSAEAAAGTLSLAELVLRSKQDDKENAARALYSDIVTAYPQSPEAPRALSRRAALEERMKLRVVDPELGSIPAAVISYRLLIRDYPTADGVEQTLDKLADAYDNAHRYELAAAALDDLAAKFPENTRDAAWRAGELYAKRVKNAEKARASFALVPASSSHYRDAQKKLAQ